MRVSTIQHASFIAILVIVTFAFLGMIRDFYQPIFWAAVLAVLFHGLQIRFRRWLRGRSSLAAVLSMMVIFLIVIVPLFFVALAVTREAVGLYERLASGKSDLQGIIERGLPIVTEYAERYGVDLQRVQERLSEAAVAASRFIASQLVSIGQVTAEFLLKFLLMLYILFFFLRDGEELTRALIRALPLGDMREKRLLARFALVSRVTVRGGLIVALIQGALGGILFWVLGIGAPVLWGLIMTVLALLPAVGAFLVWAPAAIILILGGNLARGVIMIVAGALVIGLVDNVLRPVLVGRSTRLPDFVVLIATLGGLSVFGASGLVIGPIIAALFLTVWNMFAEEYAARTDLDGKRLVVHTDRQEPS